MIGLLLSLVALLIAPAIVETLQARPSWQRAVDSAIVLSVTAMVVVEIFPSVADLGALWILALAAAGLIVPLLIEHGLHRIDLHRLENATHLATLAFALLGLSVHGFLDGAALAGADSHFDIGGFGLTAAIVLHRIPVGLTVWWLLRPNVGRTAAWTALGVIAVSTLGGFSAGMTLLPMFPPGATAGLQGFVAGTLLHVVFFRRHTAGHHESS